MILGILLALLAAYLALNLPVLLKAAVARNWLYNLDTAALDPKLFLISVATLLASTILTIILLAVFLVLIFMGAVR